MQVALSSPTFLRERAHLQARVARVSQLTLTFLRKDFYDEEDKSLYLLEEKLLHSRKIAVRSKLIIVDEISAGIAKKGTTQVAANMLEDVVCELSAMVTMLQAIAGRVERLEAAVLEQPEMVSRAAHRDRWRRFTITRGTS